MRLIQTLYINHKRIDGLSALVPQESDAEVIQSLQEMNDETGLWLYNLIKVRSCDVGFTWKTHMLLHQMITWAVEAETVEDFVASLKYYRQNGILYRKCKKHVQTIFEKSRELRVEYGYTK